MKIAFICCEAECALLNKPFKEVGIRILNITRADLKDEKSITAAGELVKSFADKDTVILFRNHEANAAIEDFFRSLPKESAIIPVESGALLLGCATADAKHVETVNRYLLSGGDVNVLNSGLYIRRRLFGDGSIDVPEPEFIPQNGLFMFDADQTWDNLEDYLESKPDKFQAYVGMVVHRHQWVRHDLGGARELALKLEAGGVGVISVFTNSSGMRFSEIVSNFFSIGGELKIEAWINCILFLVRAEGGRSIAEQSIMEYSRLGVPVISPVQSYLLDEEKWRESNIPISADMAISLLEPEIAGMIETSLISVRNQSIARTLPLPERAGRLAGRIKKWINLRKKPNREKKIAVMLHNSACMGAGATIGRAYGLDTFASVINVLKRLAAEGYDTGVFPDTGDALFRHINDRKAVSDFRWTAVEDIIRSGGCVYRMSADEYDAYYKALPDDSRDAMERTWGAPPGEGMVSEGDIIITGVVFGNVLIMVQPKRGCYGAKCTGEVCKILHDPTCPPPHQYLASYRFIEHVFKADALIDVGTEGNAEYLPGKTNGLSEKCWPDIVLGSLPSLYMYNAGVTGEALVAKRRLNSVIVGYLPHAWFGVDERTRRLVRHIDDYRQAVEHGSGQDVMIREDIVEMIKEIPSATRLMDNSDGFDAGLSAIADYARLSDEVRWVTTDHRFGEIPTDEEAENYIKEVMRGENYINDNQAGRDELIEGLAQCTNELDMLVLGLNGGYIPAGESGMPDVNGRNILPTGRNLFGMNTERIPTKTAYERGRRLARQLLDAYLNDEGRYPEKIAIAMISHDVSRTDGEHLSQVLNLLGVEPVWNEVDRVVGLRVIELSELNRPRIDVTVRITGIMRDTWPFAVEMMDEAILMVSSLNESDEQNYIVKHCRETPAEPENDNINRSADIRIFGDAPGSYGSGLNQALLSSAWKDETDLVKYFIHSSAYAYGKGLHGRKSVAEFIKNVRDIDATSDTTSTSRWNALTDGFNTQIQGGFRLLARHLGKKRVRQYHATSEPGEVARTETLAGNILRNTEAILLNEFWKSSMLERGYAGAADLLELMQYVYAAQCLNGCFTDGVLDRLAESYINDERTRERLVESNKYALEEIARRMLELHTREKWNADEQVLNRLKDNYLVIEGCIEAGLESPGAIQGGNVEIINADDVASWKTGLAEVEKHIQAATD